MNLTTSVFKAPATCVQDEEKIFSNYILDYESILKSNKAQALKTIKKLSNELQSIASMKSVNDIVTKAKNLIKDKKIDPMIAGYIIKYPKRAEPFSKYFQKKLDELTRVVNDASPLDEKIIIETINKILNNLPNELEKQNAMLNFIKLSMKFKDKPNFVNEPSEKDKKMINENEYNNVYLDFLKTYPKNAEQIAKTLQLSLDKSLKKPKLDNIPKTLKEKFKFFQKLNCESVNQFIENIDKLKSQNVDNNYLFIPGETQINFTFLEGIQQNFSDPLYFITLDLRSKVCKVFVKEMNKIVLSFDVLENFNNSSILVKLTDFISEEIKGENDDYHFTLDVNKVVEALVKTLSEAEIGLSVECHTGLCIDILNKYFEQDKENIIVINEKRNLYRVLKEQNVVKTKDKGYKDFKDKGVILSNLLLNYNQKDKLLLDNLKNIYDDLIARIN